MLEVIDIHTYYGQIEALKGLSLSVERGEIITLIGANGAGKSTLINTISGVIRPAKGEIKFLGRAINRVRPDEIVKSGILQVQERAGILKHLTVLENLILGGYICSEKKKIREDLEKVFQKFSCLKQRKNKLAATLSGGERQMLAIGRGLMAKPSLLMLDEPSLGLAPIVVYEIFEIIRNLNEEGVTILLVEQNARKALEIAQRGYVIENGRVIIEGRAEELRNNQEVQNAFLGRKISSIRPAPV